MHVSTLSGKKTNFIFRLVLIFVGTISVILGLIGVVVPLLPTTPFLLLAAACYARSSERFYHWLLHNRLFGRYLDNYRKKKGIPLAIKIGTILVLWGTILSSAIFVADDKYLEILLVLIAVAVTIHILSQRTLNADNAQHCYDQ